MLDDLDLDIQQEPPQPPPGRDNRSFLLVAGILGGIMLLGLIAMVYYALVILPNQEPPLAPELSAAELTQTEDAKSFQVSSPTATLTATFTRTPTTQPPTATPSSTNTPVTPLFTAAASSTPSGATATVNALLTQAALAQTEAVASAASPTVTTTPATATPTPGALPQSGFADEVGGPGLLIAAAFLGLIIVLARRLRTA